MTLPAIVDSTRILVVHCPPDVQTEILVGTREVGMLSFVPLATGSIAITRPERTLHVRRRTLIAYPSFRRTMVAQGISQIFDAVNTVALASLLLFDSADGPSVTNLTKMVVVSAIPLVAAGPLSGYLADRLTRRRILVVGQALRALIVACVLLSERFAQTDPMFLLWAVGLCVSRVLYTTRAASLRHLVRNHELVAADSLSLTIGTISGAVGGAIGVTVFAFLDSMTLSVVVVGHLLSSWAYARVRQNVGGGRDHVPAAWRDALQHLSSHKGRYAILATSIHRLASGTMFASIVLIGDRYGGGSPLSYAGALAVGGLGAFLGNNTAEWVNEHFPRRMMTVGVFASSSLIALGVVIVDHAVVYLVGLLLVAFVFQNLRVCSDATVQSNAIAGAGGREFALYDVSHNLAFLVGIVVGLGIHGSAGGRLVVAITGSVFALASLIFMVLSRGEEFPRVDESTVGVNQPDRILSAQG